MPDTFYFTVFYNLNTIVILLINDIEVTNNS